MKRPVQVFNFRLQNASSGSVDIFIDGAIVDAETQQIYRDWFGDDTSVSFKSFREDLQKSNAAVYNIFINSPGGMITDAMAMHDYLQDEKKRGKKVNTFGRGIVASAATYILMAGDSPEMSANSWFMIHNASGLAYGDVNEVERQATILRQFNNAIRDFYAKSTGLSAEEITNMMNAETWMLGPEAKEKGFIKQVSEEVSFTNLLSADTWDYANKDVLAAYNSAVKQPPAIDPTNTLQQFILNQNNDMKRFFENFLNGLKGLKPDENAKPADIVNQIVEALTKPLEDMSTEIENHISAQVTSVQNTVQSALTKEYGDKITNLTTEVTNLKTENTSLRTELADVKGKPTNENSGTGGNGDVKPIGGFKKS
ncbi:head maturation protease, ClpP-related [Chitinophaga sp. LS1]|uniref:head maturation protease, ClpP-related n=1 Tax=Chitinophaga sp. LS1 TaxID=3051176 RepID=UPI002AAB908E|nr:head maturation protease, ClpP-related [Chitinophaga sp. LS1]WPV66282.1 Clp protease ClpP [Chitinophaga sp. LS1]